MVRKTIIVIVVFIVALIFTFMFIYANIRASEAGKQEEAAHNQVMECIEENEQLVKSMSELQIRLDSTQSQLRNCISTK